MLNHAKPSPPEPHGADARIELRPVDGGYVVRIGGAERERDDARDQRDEYREWGRAGEEACAEAEAQIAALAAALRESAQPHRISCPVAWSHANECSCGVDALLAAAPATMDVGAEGACRCGHDKDMHRSAVGCMAANPLDETQGCACMVYRRVPSATEGANEGGDDA